MHFGMSPHNDSLNTDNYLIIAESVDKPIDLTLILTI